MRLATFNVENLFDRPKAMNLDHWKDSEPILNDFHRLNDLIERQHYSEQAKVEISKLFSRRTDYIELRENRGRLGRTAGDVFLVTANGRGDWVGWFELKEAPVEEAAIENTARVIREVHPDVLCVVEAEDRLSLDKFSEKMLPVVNGKPFKHVMLVQGRDERNINVGIMAQEPCKIEKIVSHVDDTDDHGPIFSRDCAEYTVITPSGKKLLILENHFKSKSGVSTETKRLRQAKRVREIYEQRLQEGYEYIAVTGDLNTDEASPELAPLTSDGLVDVMIHPKFVGDGLPGTFGPGKPRDKFDYILMSPKLAGKVIAGGIERRGVWGNFPHFPQITKPVEAASDHAALFVDLDL
jgi:endonuclease/exonuclease/phosphatase family metal-dependent hydrolase